MEHIVKQISDSYKGTLKDYKPFADECGIAEENPRLPDSVTGLIKDTALKHMDIPYPYISATDYMKLARCGDRAEYEAKYFAKRHKLNALVPAAYYYDRVCACACDNPDTSSQEAELDADALLDEIINGIWSVCEETSWCLPAHNTYVRDTPQIILPDAKKPVMDLFACETGALLSMICYLLKDKLDLISPLICKRIYEEVSKRIIEPYLNTHFWWMGNGDEPMCNWTVWCIQNSLLCAFLLPFEDAKRRIIFDKACYGIDCFLKDYGEDGCCEEGAQYYRHAGLCLFGCLDILNSISDGAFTCLFDNVKIKNIAEFIANVHVGGKYYVNFADCSPKPGSCGVREYLFGKLCKLSSLTRLACEDYITSLKEETVFEDESVKLNLYYKMQTIYYAKELISCTLLNSPENSCRFRASDNSDDFRDIYYESVGVCVLRSDAKGDMGDFFTLAAKAGDNNDSHNHNDTGSIILYKGLDPIFVDIGPETYSQKTFSKDRYEIWTMQSGYHNLPTIGGLDQFPGDEYRASDVVTTVLSRDCDDADKNCNCISSDAPDKNLNCTSPDAPDKNRGDNLRNNRMMPSKYISMNIASAYPLSKLAPSGAPLRDTDNGDTDECPMPKAAFRTFTYIRTAGIDTIDNSVILSDVSSSSPADIDGGIILNFITYHKPAVLGPDNTSKGCSYSLKIGSANVTYTGADAPVIETLPITDARLKKCWDHDLYRIRLTLQAQEFMMQIK